MPNLNIMIKPVSGECNLQCDYCFYKDEVHKREKEFYGHMSFETLELVIKKVMQESEKYCVIGYQGGEPTLRGIEFYRKSIEFERKHNRKEITVFHAIQTNGYSITDELLDFFLEQNFLIGVSIDGTEYMHDCFRKSCTGADTYDEIYETVKKIEKKNIPYNILTVVNAKTAKHARQIFQTFSTFQTKHWQFIPCLNPLGEENMKYPYTLSSQMYGKFLKELFDIWYMEQKNGSQIEIQLFENYISILRGNSPELCGMSGECSRQYIIEADGSVYPCDFYALDEYRLGDFTKQSIEELELMREALFPIGKSKILPQECRMCRFAKLCRGGCRRYREPWTEYGAGRNCYCEAYQDFFEYTLERMLLLAK